MRWRLHSGELQAARLLAAIVGFVLTASAAVSADLARAHMTLVANVCGGAAADHCGWCVTALGLALAGLAAFAYAAGLGRRPARVRSRR